MPETDVLPDAPSTEIYRLMGEILAELPAIGKNQRNEEQGFVFRGYDDVLNALNPIMSAKGVFVVPDVIERVQGTRQTRNNYTMYEVNLHVRFTFYAPDGSWVAGSGWGEGTDMGDKATNKAMTNAFKYVLFQTFAISTREASETDSDKYSPEESNPDVLYCRVCQTAIEGARTDKEKMRVHLIDEHGWVRVNIGTENEGVITPENAAALAAGQQDADAEGATRPAERTPAPEPDSSTVGTTPGDNPPPADDAAPDFTWIDELKGQELVATAKEWGVSASGKVQEIKDRIRDAYATQLADEAADGDDATPDATDTAPQDAAADVEPVPGGDGAPADEGGGDAAEGEGFQCPDCTAPPFPSEDAYNTHWYAEHDTPAGSDDTAADAADATPTTGDDVAALVTQVKARIADLKGEHARAYGKYRRDAKLPRPDEMDADQATALLEFLDGLAAS